MSDFQDAYTAGATQQQPRPALPVALTNHAVVLVDGTGNETIQYLPVEAITGTLAEKRGTVSFLDVDSFARYVATQKQDGTAIYVNGTKQAVVAVLDGHGAAHGWGRHRAVLVTQQTRVWQEWAKFTAEKHAQTPFAQFIESHISEIATPDGATLLEMVTTLEVKANVAFASATKLQNGQVQLTYNEQIEGTTQKGSTTIPENLVLYMQPIEGGGQYVIDAKLRYRMVQGQLTLGVELHRPLDVLERAFADRIADLASKVGADLIFQGDAPAEVTPIVRK